MSGDMFPYRQPMIVLLYFYLFTLYLVCALTYAMVHVWRLEYRFQELVVSFHNVRLRNLTQARLIGKAIYPLSHPTGTPTVFSMGHPVSHLF